jgi:hypothetical protein
MKTILKVTIVIVLIGVITSFVWIGNKEKAKPVVKAQLVGYTKDSYLEAKVSLINYSSDTINYIGYTCPEHPRFILNTDTMDVLFQDWDCNASYPIKLKLLPHDIDTFIIQLGKENWDLQEKRVREQRIGLTFKVGLPFISADTINCDKKSGVVSQWYTRQVDNKFKDKNIVIWSNEVKITKDLPIVSEH